MLKFTQDGGRYVNVFFDFLDDIFPKYVLRC